MMEPAEMSWPPKAFTPNILGCESRPFRVEPPPFFCAISTIPGYGSAVYRADLQFGIRLTMAGVPLVVLATAHLEDSDLWMQAMRHHGRLHCCTADHRRAD